MSETPLLRCSRVSCGYPGRTVLRDVAFELRAGENVVLLGPNGSGKSTLLNTILKNLPLLQGEVALGGKSLANLTYRELAHLVAYVPQEETPTFAFPVETFVAMGRMPVSGGFFDTEDDKAAADEAMRITDCLALRDRSIQELSGGERQRVWIARALAQGASILLLDEPSSHLDVSHQLTLIELAKSLSGKGLAVLSAVHDLNLASSMADRAILLADGTIGMDSKMEEVLQSPLLEKVYGVQFARFTAAGAIRVLPERKL